MRKLLLLVVAAMVIAVVFGMALAAYLNRPDADMVTRAEMVTADLQKLTVGTSNYKAAQAIAKRFGTVPYENHYGTQDCADGYFERCAYMIRLNNGPRRRLLLKYPYLRRFGAREWGGTAFIYIKNGTVEEYSLGITYRTSTGQWRGFGAEEARSLPENRAVQARMSGSYSVERNDIRMGERPSDLGFQLESSLTPAAMPAERQRAWNFRFACLADAHGCGEICEVMPDAWRDFYTERGHFDVEKYGSAYLFCTKPPAQTNPTVDNSPYQLFAPLVLHALAKRAAKRMPRASGTTARLTEPVTTSSAPRKIPSAPMTPNSSSLSHRMVPSN